ncbi:MAG: histidine kinase [Flavobacteriales bacterium]|nr:histidine kinase [Flavobacteriales bacterium]
MEKKQMEIDFLKSRVNPHFLFNALGGIHSLAVLQSEKTPLLIEELSKLMRYTFYDCQQARVSLSKELAFIESFINFHQLKAKDALRVNFKHDIEDGYTIEPLLFIGTIENAYKHGNVLAGGKIDLSLHLQKGKLKFVCSNSFSQQGKVQKTHQSGFGVKNLEQRLISHYPDKHQLVIEKSDDIYTVKIELEIDEKI